MKRLLIIIGVLFLILIVYSKTSKTVTGDEETAEEYIKSKGYKIISYKGEINRYTLEKSRLKLGITGNIPYQEMWAVQNVEPDIYFGKEITIYGFTVKNHPLQKQDSNAKKGVNLHIMMSDRKVIGGYSYPDANVKGAYSSLDGKTIEFSYQQWIEKWMKYENQ